MKGLIHLDTLPFLKRWMYFLVLHILASIYIVHYANYHGSLFSILTPLVIFFIFLSPIYIFYSHREFVNNIEILNNLYYTRKKLIYFYLVNQSIRLLLTLAIVILYLKSNDLQREFSILNKTLVESPYDINFILLAIIFAFTFFYGFPLHKQKYRHNYPITKKTKSKKSKWVVIILAILLGLFLLCDIKFILPTHLLLTPLSFLIPIFITLSMFQEKFLIFTHKTYNKLCLFICCFVFMISIINLFIDYNKLSKNITLIERIDILESLGSFTPEDDGLITNDIIATNNRDLIFRYFQYRGTKGVDVALVAEFLLKKHEDVDNFIRLYKDQKLDEEQTITIIDKLDHFAGRTRYGDEITNTIHRIIVNAKFDRLSYIDSLLVRNTPFTRHCALELLYHSQTKIVQKQKLSEYKDSLSLSEVERSFNGDLSEEFKKIFKNDL